MNNPLHILQTLDRHLTKPAEITIFGRAALALGFPNSPAAFATTQDVDAILPLPWIAADVANMDFWQALQKTNAGLEPAGLYITHLFGEEQVMLRRQWEQHIVPITRLDLKWLQLTRPATIDLLLTKMIAPLAGRTPCCPAR